MTDIVETPPAPVVVPFPVLGSTNYNDHAFAAGAALPALSAGMHALAVATRTNSVAGHERALAAEQAKIVVTEQADLAMTYRNTAGLHATTATDQASLATAKAGEAAASAVQAAKLNLGAKNAPPALDNQGAALLAGATYYDTTLAKWRVWTGAAWVEGVSAIAGVSSINGLSGPVSGIATLEDPQTLANKTLASPMVTGAMNEARGADVASAASPDIWNAGGNLLAMTGTAAVSGFPAAPCAGAWRRIIAAGAFSLVSSSSLVVKGGSCQMAVGDELFVIADTLTTFRVTVVRADGSSTAPVAQAPVGSITAIYSDTLPNTIVTSGATYLKTGVVDSADVYPLAPRGPYMVQSLASTPNLTGANPVFGAGLWLIPTTGGIVHSADAYAWTFIPLEGVTLDSACAFVNGRFMVFQHSGNLCYTSLSGKSWTAQTLPVSGQWREVAHNGTRYVAVNGTATIAVSVDAITWTSLGVTSVANWVVYGSGKFVIVGGTNCRTSTDGLAWTLQATPTPGDVAPTSYAWAYVAWNGSTFLAITDIAWNFGSTAYQTYGMKSADGVSWSSHTLPTTQSDWGNWGYCYGVGVAGGNFYLGGLGHINQRVGWYGNTVAAWTAITGPYRQYLRPFPAGISRGKVAVNGSVWLWGGGLISRNSGASWGGTSFQVALESCNATPGGVSYGNGIYIAAAWVQPSAHNHPVAFAGVSSDGLEFGATQIVVAGAPVQLAYKSAVFFNGKHHIGASSSQVLSTADGITWTQASIGGDADLLHIANNRLFAFRDSFGFTDPATPSTTSSYRYTADAVTWLGGTFPQQSPCVVAHGGGKWMMACGNGATYSAPYTSDDGVNAWTSKGSWPSGHSADTRGLVYAQGAFYRFGKDGKVSVSTDLGVTWMGIASRNGTISDCDWARTDGTTIIAGANNTADYLISKDGINFFARKAPLKQLYKFGSLANGRVFSSISAPLGVLVPTTIDYVLNDRAQFTSLSSTALGSQCYMKVS
ncbi:MAG: hypothetical protein PHU77_00435 [Simplicispira sp.]|nr:hypothetical protein [Simplicispira sp.]